MSRERIAEIIKQLQTAGPDTHQLIKELVELKRSLGDLVPEIDLEALPKEFELRYKKPAKSKKKKNQ